VSVYTATKSAQAEDIDELGHVNNAVWVRWIEEIATAHWRTAADSAHVETYVWVITRHEIDYLKPLLEGQSVTGRTWAEQPKGARSVRLMEFVGTDETVHVRSRTTWAMINRTTGRLQRVTPDIVAPFLP